ncbi:MAG: 4a-hydroxytetrahydrobiopterin dehydratase [Burkholderiaceae bacterium]|nr:4a-hydroxytetrahydrobiopterin dehydratase [Burkholderiaceae bacterium]
MLTRAELLDSVCRHRTNGASDERLGEALAVLTDWIVDGGKLSRGFRFADYHQTLAFVNAIADVIHAEDHHPELVVGYNRCAVKFDTHSVNEGKGGLSDNDFICAAKIDAVFDSGSWRNDKG